MSGFYKHVAEGKGAAGSDVHLIVAQADGDFAATVCCSPDGDPDDGKWATCDEWCITHMPSGRAAMKDMGIGAALLALPDIAGLVGPIVAGYAGEDAWPIPPDTGERVRAIRKRAVALAEALKPTRALKPFRVTWTLEVTNVIWAESATEADAALKGYDIDRVGYDVPDWADAEITIYPSHHKTQFEDGNEVVGGGKLLDPHNLPFRVVNIDAPKGGAQ